VFDPCAGSGSHLLVAEENNRRFVGCELQKEWFDKAKERL
jgi:DNA modification methylase